MRTVCLYFQVHQPFRFRRYRFFDIGNDHYYYDDYVITSYSIHYTKLYDEQETKNIAMSIQSIRFILALVDELKISYNFV